MQTHQWWKRKRIGKLHPFSLGYWEFGGWEYTPLVLSDSIRCLAKLGSRSISSGWGGGESGSRLELLLYHDISSWSSASQFSVVWSYEESVLIHLAIGIEIIISEWVWVRIELTLPILYPLVPTEPTGLSQPPGMSHGHTSYCTANSSTSFLSMANSFFFLLYFSRRTLYFEGIFQRLVLFEFVS